MDATLVYFGGDERYRSEGLVDIPLASSPSP